MGFLAERNVVTFLPNDGQHGRKAGSVGFPIYYESLILALYHCSVG